MPTWLAFAVTRLLEEHFGRLVDYDFTAEMEDDLDKIASGQENRVHWLSRFYFDSDGGLKPLVDDLGDIDARDINTIDIGDGIVLRVGRYGPYLEAPGENGTEPRRASVPDDVAPDELDVAKARELLETNADGDRELGVDPDTGRRSWPQRAVRPVRDRGRRGGRQRVRRSPARGACSRACSFRPSRSTTRCASSRSRGSSASIPRAARRSRRRTAGTAPISRRARTRDR